MCSRARPVNTVAAAAPSATRVATASHGTNTATARRMARRAATAEALLCGSVGRRELP